VTLLGRLCRDPANQAYWAEFVDRYWAKIYGWCRQWGLQEADAQDVTQDVLLRLAGRIRHFRYDPGKSFLAWLMTVTRHAYVDFLDHRQQLGRGSGDSQVLEMLRGVEARDDLLKKLDEEFDRELLEEAMARVRLRVAPQTWEAFRLTAPEGLRGPRPPGASPRRWPRSSWPGAAFRSGCARRCRNWKPRPRNEARHGPCPSPDQLERLLEEELSPAELRAVSAHVAACAICQAALERLTDDDGPGPAPPAPTINAHPPLPEPSRAFFGRLKQAVAPAPPPPPDRSPDDTPDPARPPVPPVADAPGSPDMLAWPSVPGYEILGELGRSGMGIVYRARQAGLNRPLALKLIRAEAKAAARLRHHNIVQVYDTGECQGRPHFVLELVEGGSLAARLRGEPQPAEASARLVEVLARAIDCAHQAGVIHRDLKPASVLLAPTPKSESRNPKQIETVAMKVGLKAWISREN
jgi:RNA polymerase sigma-70 factor (ECF subfamily)